MDEKDLKCLLLNLYNIMVIHGTVHYGQPTTQLERHSFFGGKTPKFLRLTYLGVMYNIGGYDYSLNQIEHGMLRGNQKPPYNLFRTFGERDPRIKLCLKLDPRIHFALVCGAKSCPPIRIYTPENLEKVTFEKILVPKPRSHVVVVVPVFCPIFQLANRKGSGQSSGGVLLE